jgi:hypothetical protein
VCMRVCEGLDAGSVDLGGNMKGREMLFHPDLFHSVSTLTRHNLMIEDL